MIMIFFPFVRRVRAINFTRFLLILLLFHSYLIIKSFLLYYEVIHWALLSLIFLLLCIIPYYNV